MISNDLQFIQEFPDYNFEEQVYKHLVYEMDKYNQIKGYQERFDPYYDKFSAINQNSTNNYIYPDISNYTELKGFYIHTDGYTTHISSDKQQILMLSFNQTGVYRINITNRLINFTYDTQSNTFMFYSKDGIDQYVNVIDESGNYIDYNVRLFKQDTLTKQSVTIDHDIYFNKFNIAKIIMDYYCIGTSQMHNIELDTGFTSYIRNINEPLEFQLNDNYLEDIENNVRYILQSSEHPNVFFNYYYYDSTYQQYSTLYLAETDEDIQSKVQQFIDNEKELRDIDWQIAYTELDTIKVEEQNGFVDKVLYRLLINCEIPFDFIYFYTTFFTEPILFQDINNTYQEEYEKTLDKQYYKPHNGIPVLTSTGVFQTDTQRITGIDQQLKKTYYFTVELDDQSLDNYQKSINLRNVNQRNVLEDGKIIINDDRFRIPVSEMTPKETFIIINGVYVEVTDKDNVTHTFNWFKDIPTELISDKYDNLNHKYWQFPVLVDIHDITNNDIINEQVQYINGLSLTNDEKLEMIRNYFDEQQVQELGTRKFKIKGISVQLVSTDNLITMEESSTVNLGKLLKPIKSVYIFSLANNEIEITYQGKRYTKCIDLTKENVYLKDDFIININLGDLEGIKLVIGYEPQSDFSIATYKDVLTESVFTYNHNQTPIDQNTDARRSIFKEQYVYEQFDYSQYVSINNLINYSPTKVQQDNFIQKSNVEQGVYSVTDQVYIPYSFQKPLFTLYLDDILINERYLHNNIDYAYINLYPKDKHYIQHGTEFDHKPSSYDWSVYKYFYHDTNKNTMQLRLTGTTGDILKLYYNQTDYILITTDGTEIIVDHSNTNQTVSITGSCQYTETVDIKIDYYEGIQDISIDKLKVHIEHEYKLNYLEPIWNIVKAYNTAYTDWKLDKDYFFNRTQLRITHNFTNHYEQGSFGFLKTYLVQLL